MKSKMNYLKTYTDIFKLKNIHLISQFKKYNVSKESIDFFTQIINENGDDYMYNDGGVDRYDFVVEEIVKNNYKKIIDISSGRGLLIEAIKNVNPNIDITSTDLSKFNEIDVKFIELDLTNKNDYHKVIEKYEFLSCLDVLEHIEEKYIEDILIFFKSLAENFIFTIANHSDIINGIELHLIQKDKIFWNILLTKHFEIVDTFSKYNNKLYCYILKNKCHTTGYQNTNS
jgi:hypothetical protein